MKTKQNTNLIVKYDVGGAISGAMKGFQYGGTFGPIGMVAGALVGGVAGNYLENKNNELIEQQKEDKVANTNMNPYGIISMENGGFVLNNPLINIQSGELLVDKSSGDIIEEYSKERGFKSHSKNNKDDARNFVVAQDNSVVIPKNIASKYKDNIELRKGILRNIINKSNDRMLYGVDSDGNKVEFANIETDMMKMSSGAFIKKYYTGGPTYTIPEGVDIKKFQQYAGIADDGIWGKQTQKYWDLKGRSYMENMNGTLNLKPISTSPFDYTPTTINANNNTTSPFPHDPLMDNSNSLNLDPSLSVFNNDNALPINTTEAPVNNAIKSNDSLWTLGNSIGAIGSGISALGPLLTTLSNGKDTVEHNRFSNVATRAEGQVDNIFRGVENKGIREINMNANTANNFNRNRVTNFNSMLANSQNIAKNSQKNISEFLNSITNSKASILSDIMFKGDMANAQGLQSRDERLDMNRDNYYTNLSNNLSNLGTNVQGFGMNLNQHEYNKTQLNTLKQLSPDFDIDSKGNITFKGQLIK